MAKVRAVETERARANSWENLYGKLNEKYLLAIHAKYCSQKTNAFLDHPTLFSDNEIDELTLEVSENEIIVSEHTRKTSQGTNKKQFTGDFR